MDVVFINKLIVFTTIGVYDWEHNIKQKLLLDIEMRCDTKLAAITDNVKYCINYEDVSAVILAHLTNNSFFLIERVAEEIANLLMNNFNILGVRIKVIKHGTIKQATQVGVKIERGYFPINNH